MGLLLQKRMRLYYQVGNGLLVCIVSDLVGRAKHFFVIQTFVESIGFPRGNKQVPTPPEIVELHERDIAREPSSQDFSAAGLDSFFRRFLRLALLDSKAIQCSHRTSMIKNSTFDIEVDDWRSMARQSLGNYFYGSLIDSRELVQHLSIYAKEGRALVWTNLRKRRLGCRSCDHVE